ncbi:CK1 family protein kinase [Tritrichomonas foetus]|uniref:non-specific serine/threonine protein kinase n=1 Tax=Tritrichomonas foetus TaxID=1144522 RepID=A0A1J4JW53_9EUKA|nr:CK1 family protein kinase [Tritrichomonas foetus]|eukprot:OHT01758.1 CK1 family protein kinase [Tritrichomonas foetus]
MTFQLFCRKSDLSYFQNHYQNPKVMKSDRVFGGRYSLIRKIGAGSFGEIYFGEDKKTGKSVAIKIEQLKTQVPQLSAESKVYSVLSGGVNVCKLHYFGIEIKTCAMVIDFLGKSLESLRADCGGTLSIKTVAMLADQMISSIEWVHRNNYIHRDIKPDNFMIGLGNTSNQLFVIDFGLAKYYRDPQTQQHIAYTEHNSFAGTARYASAASLGGIEPSRRDDMEAIAYVLAYLLKGTLPWMNIEANSVQASYDKNVAIKLKSTPEQIFDGMPIEFVNFLKDIKKLKFQDEPNYAKYRKMFRDMLIRLDYIYDFNYDWVGGITPCKPSHSHSAVRLIPRVPSTKTRLTRKPMKIELVQNRATRSLKIPLAKSSSSLSLKRSIKMTINQVEKT